MRRFAAGILFAGLLAGAARGADAPIPAPELLGRTIASIAYTCDGPADRREIESLVTLRVGAALAEDDTATTIENLFGTLDFSNVLIVAAPAGDDGVDVTIHLWRAYRVSRIRIEGKSSLSGEETRRAIPFAERDPFNAGALAEGASALERRLVADGYIHASVDPEATFDPATFTVDVVYRIAAGQRARVAVPLFDGRIEPFTADVLLSASRLKVGAAYQESKVRAAADRLRRHLLEEGRYKAVVELIAAEPTEEGAIRPVFRIAVGPLYEIAVTGIKEKTVRREFLALLDTQALDEDLLDQWTTTTREALQREGRYRATVSATTSGTDPVVIKVDVVPGAKYAVERITFAGNGSVSEETLRTLIVTRKKGIPFIQKGRLLDADLEGDANAILGYYQTRGWITAKVDRPAVTEGSKPDLLDVAFTIVEGPRTFVAESRVEGADHLTPAEIEGLLTVRTGEPFNPSAVRQDVATLTTRYWNTGWREASVKEHWTLSPDKTKVDVLYTVDEGMRSFFGKTILRGNGVTDPNRILRQVTWKEGEPFSEEKVADTQRNLARTGAFRSIEVRPQPANPDNQEHTVDINLTEARRISLLYGVGYQYASGATAPSDPFATAGVTYRNLFGRMQSASLEVQYAPISGRGYVIANFLEPYLFNTDVPLTIATFASREPIQDIEVDRLGIFFESARQFGHLRAALRYSYQYIAPRNPQDLSVIIIDKYPLSARPIRQSAIGPSFLYDQRDDVLDPHKGYYVTIAGGYAFPFLNATASYGKVSGQAAYFVSVLGGVLAAAYRVGAIYPKAVFSEADTVPVAEKFFAGGSSTARGFDTNLEGIAGETVDNSTQTTLAAKGPGTGTCAPDYTFPGASNYDCSPGPRIVGGNGFMAFGLEYRIPIVGSLGLSVFYDLAQVWANSGDINFAIERQTSPQGLRQSIGLGLHYMTPIGPLRLEVGRPVNIREYPVIVTAPTNPDGTQPPPLCVPEPGRSCGPPTKEKGRIFLSIGYPF